MQFLEAEERTLNFCVTPIEFLDCDWHQDALADKATIDVRVEGGGLRVTPEGALTSETIGVMREKLERGIPAKFSGAIVFDLSKVAQIDASGVSLAVFLYRLAKARGLSFETSGGDKDRRLLVDLALRGQDPEATIPPIGFVREMGVAALSLQEILLDLIRFIGEISLVLVRIARRPALLRLRDTIAAMSRHGTDAIPVVSLLGLLIGAIIAFQTFDPLAKYGAKLQVADVVAISIVRELARLLGGDVSLRSEFGKGSLFIVRLPIIAPDKKKMETVETAIEPRTSPAMPLITTVDLMDSTGLDIRVTNTERIPLDVQSI